jgi:H+/Cl- antiporter ClcA
VVESLAIWYNGPFYDFPRLPSLGIVQHTSLAVLASLLGYALIAAGSTMCGVTRLSVTLAIILFELTGSLDYVLPFSLAILVAKWTADLIEPLSIYVSCTILRSLVFC